LLVPTVRANNKPITGARTTYAYSYNSTCWELVSRGEQAGAGGSHNYFNAGMARHDAVRGLWVGEQDFHSLACPAPAGETW
jgi:hypothetical protein